MHEQHKFLPILIIFSLIAACIEIDISVPSFPDMIQYFQADAQKVQNTLTFNFIGICLAGFLYGSLSDSYGRRKIMLVGSLLFALGSIGCVAATSIDMMIICRFIQGIGTSDLLVIAYAVIADVYQGAQATKFMGIMNSVITAFMAIAPVLGGFINEHLGWRANYSTVAILSVVSLVALYFGLPETLKEKRTFSLKDTLSDYAQLAKSFEFVSYGFIGGALCGAYLAYVASASIMYINTMNHSMLSYSINQAVIIGGFSVFSMFVGKFQERFGIKGCIQTAVTLHIIGATGLLWAGLTNHMAAHWMTLFMTLYGIGSTFLFNLSIVLAMELFPELKGAVSAALNSLKLGISALCVGGLSFVFDGSLKTVSLTIGLITALYIILLACVFGPIRKLRTLS